MSQALSYESFAGRIGVCIDTLYQWEKDQPAWKIAKGIAWAKSLYAHETILNRSYVDKKINITSLIYSMKCRHGKQGWNPQNQPENSGELDDYTFE